MKLYIWLALFLCISFNANAAIQVVDVDISCQGERCVNVVKNLQRLSTTYNDETHLLKTLDGIVVNAGVNSFAYKWDRNIDKYHLYLQLDTKPVIDKVDLKINKSFRGELPESLPIGFGDFWDANNERKLKNYISDYLENIGYPSSTIDVKTKDEKQYVDIKVRIKSGKPIVLNSIVINSESDNAKEIFQRKINHFLKKPFNLQALRVEIDDYIQILKDYGYYSITLNNKSVNKNNKIDLIFDISEGTQFAFDAKETIFFTIKDIKNELKNLANLYKDDLNPDTIKTKVVSMYKERGVANPVVEVEEEKSKNIWGLPLKVFRINVFELERTRFGGVYFKGNGFLSDKELEKLFKTNATELVKNDYYDALYYENFRNILLKHYYEKGYVAVNIGRPSIKYRKEQNEVIVEYRIKEHNKAVVNSISLDGVTDSGLKDKIFKVFTVKINGPLNPIELPAQLKAIEDFLHSEGYYNAQITNLNRDNLVLYSPDASKADIEIKINLGEKIHINRIIILGNIKTKTKLINREILTKEGNALVAQDLKRSQTNLLSLGLFSNIKIDVTEIDDKKADVYVVVKEKEAGAVEIAPGYRTDLGAKVSGTWSYNNIDGMNKVLSLKGQVNHRLNYDTFDERRRNEKNSFLEYQAAANYSENHIFDSAFNFSTSISTSRKRFYSFDADINRVNMTVSRDFTNWFSSSVRYQFETISQFDATNTREEGEFTIGSITPSVTFDFRDSRITPTKGAYFNLSTEFANPSFLSQSTDDLVIDYYKVVARNRFYYPIPNGVFALSVSLGMQENLATAPRTDGQPGLSGYIPSIKVFRLSGIDIVRGYEDEEINRLPSGIDVSDAMVDGKAYMANIKVEPRFFLNDAMMLGVFYDAGRVFVDEFDLSALRSSVGLSFKILTPVGSLDIDYGIKLLRKKDNNGNLETPGRLHVSIGFF